MRIHSFSTIIAFPFIIVAAVILYFLFFEDKESWYPYLFPLVIVLAAIYAFHPKIDYWWHKKNPPDLGSKLKKLIYNASPFFRNLDQKGRQRFLDRLGVFSYHKAFYLMLEEKEEMPIDMKALISINAITLTFHKENYFFEKYDYYIAYQHPFPTPNKQQLHSVEVNHEDGVLLFNADALFKFMVLNQGKFNIGLYAFAEAYLVSNPLDEISQCEEPDLSLIELIEDLSMDKIIEAIGYREIYAKAVLISLYFTHKQSIKMHFSAFYELCKESFG